MSRDPYGLLGGSAGFSSNRRARFLPPKNASMAASSIHSIVYVSTAVKPFSTEELAQLLDQSRERNQKRDITGMLLYKDGCFMQAFEGERGMVMGLHWRIERDPRHRNIVVLLDGPVLRREFPEWTMGFKNLGDEDIQLQPGFQEMSNSLTRGGQFSMDPSLAKRLLLSFTEQPV
ncbi:MAG: BLUF domain-containing protein [Chthoniobacteraceae bacterium]